MQEGQLSTVWGEIKWCYFKLQENKKHERNQASGSTGSKWNNAEGFFTEHSLPNLCFDLEESVAKCDIKKYLMKTDLVK